MTQNEPILLLTRPIKAANFFARRVRDEGIVAEVLISPVQGIEPAEFDTPSNIEGAIFTSRNGVEAVEGHTAPCWCVGSATAEAAKRKGWHVRGAEADAEHLFRRILADRPSENLIHFRGQFARGNLAERLTEKGLSVCEIVAYHQVSLQLSDAAKAVLTGDTPIILPLFSPRSAVQVVQQGPFAAPVHVVAMSDAVASEAAALSPKTIRIAAVPDATAMVAAIKHVVNNAQGVESSGNST